ncbi:MAG: phosphoenolpyruvate--protein phosphotransferase, partial [Cyclonatronaceae bacterium]
HSAIIARSLGIPAIFNLGPELETVDEGQLIALNAETGRVYLQPDENRIRQIEQKRSQWLEIRERAHKHRKESARTADGQAVQVLANIGNEHEINQVLDLGAEGVGLFRSEFIFMGRNSLPTEEEQLQAYKTAAQALGGQKPLVIRTLDVGGDKPIPYLGIEAEENPFMGLRGIRYSLSRPEEFKIQLRALLRASAFGKISIMFPMIARPGEVNEALQLLDTARRELRQEGHSYDEALKTGIMIEVPAAAEDLERLLPLVDFISIGTNDLCQYMMAADRTNTAVSELSSYFQPVLLRVIRKVIETARAAETDVSVCGEMARDPLVMPFLLAAGLRKFSMSAAGIPEFKWRLRHQSAENAAYMMEELAVLQTPEDVQRYFKGVLEAAM